MVLHVTSAFVQMLHFEGSLAFNSYIDKKVTVIRHKSSV